MADENRNTGPKLGGASDPAREQVVISREALRNLGDYNDLLKDSTSELKRIIKAYETIEGKLGSLSDGSINIKEIEKSINKLTQDRINVTNKLKNIESGSLSEGLKRHKRLSEDILKYQNQTNDSIEKYAKDFDRLSQEQREDLKSKIDANKNLVESLRTQKEEQFNSLDVEEQSYINRKKTLNLIEEQLEYARQMLKNEKAAKENLGLSGGFAKILADKLGVGKTVYSAMIEKAKNLNGEEGKNMTLLQKRFAVLKAGIGAGFGSVINKFKDPVALAAMISGSIFGIGSLLKSAFDYIVGIQDKTVKFARAMNMSTPEARALKMEFASLSVSSGDLFINSQKMVESQMELTEALGVTNVLSKEILATNIKLKDIAGLEADTRAGLASTATITGRTSEQLTKSILAQVVGLKQATGVQFQNQKILKEAATQGGYLGLQFAKYPEKLTKSLLTVKAMGMELKQLDSMADSFLDFESSISKEFEAQLLTGKQINLSKARELFLNNDLAGAAAEINSQVGSSADFLKLNRIQAESLSAAFGMSRDQMGDMLKQQELLAKLGAKQGDSAREQLRIGVERYKNQKALSAAIGEEAYQNLVNASTQEKIAAFMEKIKQSISDFVENSGIIDKIEQFVKFLSEPKNIKMVIETLRDWFATAVDAVLQITNGVINAIDFITFGFGIDENFERKFEAFSAGAGNRIRSLGGDLSGIGVGEKRAKSETNSGRNTIDNMAMRPGAATNLNVIVNNTNDVNGKTVSDVLVKQTNADGQTGPMSVQSSGG